VGMTFARSDGWELRIVGGTTQFLECDILETNVETWMMIGMDVFLIRLGSHTWEILVPISSDACPIKGRGRFACKSNKVQSHQRIDLYCFLCDGVRRQSKDSIVSRLELGSEEMSLSAKWCISVARCVTGFAQRVWGGQWYIRCDMSHIKQSDQYW